MIGIEATDARAGAQREWPGLDELGATPIAGLPHAESAERSAEPAAFRDAADQHPLAASVKISVDGGPVLVTTERDLDDGDVVYLDLGGRRRAHRIFGLRPGLRGRDSSELRVGFLSEITA